jgi:hypothetical protein
MDDDRRTRDALGGVDPSQILFARDGGYRLMRRLAPDAAGLPVSVVLDKDGGVCAVKRGALTTNDAGLLSVACADKRPRS